MNNEWHQAFRTAHSLLITHYSLLEFMMSRHNTIDTKEYLKRINYRGEINNSAHVLTELQNSHLFSVPFENLDIHLGRRIDLSNSYDKIVNHKRGGFCYELNGTFFQLLKVIGFDVKLISARVRNKEMGFGA